MKIDLAALYQKSLLGGMGGLFGWALMLLLVHVPGDNFVAFYLRVLMTGALIGLALGAACGAWDGLFRERSKRRTVQGARTGAIIGFFGGSVGLFFGEILFTLAGGGLFVRAIGWGLFGALVGTNEGIARKMPQKTWYGAFGGLIGGLIGGSTYESLAGAVQAVGFGRDTGLAVGGAVGLVLLGMFIGGFIALVEDILRSAWLVFTSGHLEGQSRTLDPKKSETIIGRSELADICILRDPKIAQHHARFVPHDGGFRIEALEGEVLLNGEGGMAAVADRRLVDGDLIQIGALRAKYQTGEMAT